MQYFGLSNKGMVRGSNEDFFHVPKNTDDNKIAFFSIFVKDCDKNSLKNLLLRIILLRKRNYKGGVEYERNFQ